MTTPAQQILNKCKEVFAKAKVLYGLDMEGVHISFDLKGTAAGKAGGRGYRLPASAYYMKFNRDMLSREAFNHVINNTVPHEIAHVVCYMNPNLGRSHDHGWASVCRALGGTGLRGHSEEVVYGKGNTYEYTTDRGHKVRLSQKRHAAIQRGCTLSYRRGMGTVSAACAYSIVGVSGRSLATPVQRAATAPVAPVAAPVTPRVPTFAAGQSKAAISRAIMLAGYRAGHSYEAIISAMMLANGYDRSLARGTFKANAPKVGIPTTFG